MNNDARDAIAAAIVAQAMTDESMTMSTAQPGWAGGIFDPMGSRSHSTFDESPDHNFAPTVTPESFSPTPTPGNSLVNPPGTFDPLSPYDDSAVPGQPTDIPVSAMPELPGPPDFNSNMPSFNGPLSAPGEQDASLGGQGAVAGLGDLGLGDLGDGSAGGDNTGGSSGVG